MRSFRFALLALGCVVGASSADMVLGPYLTPAADSATVNKLYGVQSYSNPSSITTVTVPDDTAHFLRLTAVFASDAKFGYSANLGILHPMNKSWSAVNISATDTIQFDFRYDVKPKGGMEVLLSSKLYPTRCADSGLTYLFTPKITSLPAAGVWKTIKIPVTSFAPPSWWSQRLAAQGLTLEGTYGKYPTLDEVLRNLQAIQFAPKTTYTDSGTQFGSPCGYCVTPTMPAINFDIRNVRLIGYEEVLPNPDRVGCRENPTATVDSAIDDNANELGGWWFAYSDTSADAAKANDSARGTSNASMTLGAGFATLTAGLHKNTGVVGFDWRPYAGWAAIGMNFEDSISTAFGGMSGISFNITKVNVGPNVSGINFKVQIPGIDVAKTHFAYLPVGKLDGSSICVRPSDLLQPSWVSGAVPFKADSVLQLAWEAKIADQNSPAIANDTAVFKVSNIQIHGDTGVVSVRKRAIRGVFGVRYADGILSVLPKAGYENISIVSPSGRTVARLQPGVRSAAIKLDRGTWIVVARNGKGETLTNKFAVMR